MTASLLAPLVAAVALALIVTGVHRRLQPNIAARMSVVSLAVSAIAAVSTLWLVAMAFVAHLPLLGGRLEWCAMVLGIHQQVSPIVGIPAATLAIGGVVRLGRLARAHRRLRSTVGGVIEIENCAPLAYTLPGRHGTIVTSSGLRELLSPRELDAVLAHERSHAVHRHDRHLLIAHAAQAAFPLLRPLAERLHFSLERWADEDAARSVDVVSASDIRGGRAVVASALAKVALAPTGPAMALGFTGLGFAGLEVTRRVEALLDGPPPRVSRWFIGSAWVGVLGVAVLASAQLHHLGLVVAALCRA